MSAPYDPESVPCLYFPARAPGSNKIVLFCHGNAEDLGNSPGKLAKIRDNLGVHVIGVEYPGYGISSGTPSESALTADITTVFTFLTEVVNWPSKDIICFGYSIGTGPTTALAASQNVGALVLLSPYTSIRDMVGEVLPKGVGKFAGYLISNRFVNSSNIPKVTCPILIIHGRKDSLIPCTHSEILYKACSHDSKLLYLVEEMDHNYTDDDFECYVLFPMMDFLDLGASKPNQSQPRELVFPTYIFRKPPSEETKKLAAARKEYEAKHGFQQASSGEDEDSSEGDPNSQQDQTSPGGRRLQRGEHRAEAPSRLDPAQMPNHPLAPKGAPPVVDIVAWSCTLCTFENRISITVCEMCVTPRAASANANAHAKSHSLERLQIPDPAQSAAHSPNFSSFDLPPVGAFADFRQLDNPVAVDLLPGEEQPQQPPTVRVPDGDTDDDDYNHDGDEGDSDNNSNNKNNNNCVSRKNSENNDQNNSQNTWTCPICTFINAPNTEECSMCGVGIAEVRDSVASARGSLP